MEKIPKSNKPRALNKAVGPGKKNPKLINVGLTFILNYVQSNENERYHPPENITVRIIRPVHIIGTYE